MRETSARAHFACPQAPRTRAVLNSSRSARVPHISDRAYELRRHRTHCRRPERKTPRGSEMADDDHSVSRRTFIQLAIVGGAGVASPDHLFGASTRGEESGAASDS